jgi:hypothetical protein
MKNRNRRDIKESKSKRKFRRKKKRGKLKRLEFLKNR